MTERIGVISDIHGNFPALRAVLEDLRQQGCDRLVVLGDIINGIDPQGCVALLREWGNIVCVRGNAEAYTLTPDLEGLPDDEMFSSVELIQLVGWFRAQLTVESFQWLTDFPDFLIEDGTCYVHDSPIDRIEKQRWHRPNIDDKYQEWFYHSPGIQRGMPDEQWDELIEFLHRYNILYLFCGHTHVPFQRKTGDRLVVNAGSVGLPLDGDPRATWVLVEGRSDGTRKINVKRVEYELRETFDLVDQMSDYPGFSKPGSIQTYKKMLLTGVFQRA